ncbi:MAG TPA: hypothetical protein PLF57_00160 [Candidatus Saccharibacteria bacterium]|nr:hypothetical protein [Candidatus Saccharibacteria bacterium]
MRNILKKSKPDYHSIPKFSASKEESKEISDSKKPSDMVISSVTKSGSMHLATMIRGPYSTRKRKLIFAGSISTIAAILLGGFLLIPKFTNTTKNNPTTEKILTVDDFENPNVVITPQTTNASVDNLTKELKTKIDKQIAAKQNPFETVYQLASVLDNTTNKSRQNQLTGFIQDFLANHEDTLWYKIGSETPDQAQVNYWKALLYVKLVYNYQFIMLNKFTGSDGKLIDTTKDQLKYIDLYLDLANNPESHSRSTAQYKNALLAYEYDQTEDFIVLKNKLSGGGQ